MKWKFWEREPVPSPLVSAENIDLRDLIYFDVERVASIYSQLRGGLVREIQDAVESTGELRGSLTVDAKLLKTEHGSTVAERVSRLESKVFHHDLLVRVEDDLSARGLLLDLHESMVPDNADQARHRITARPYVRSEGLVVIDDYSGLQSIARNFNSLAAFIQRCGLSNFEQSDAYRELTEIVSSLERNASTAKGPERQQARDELRANQEALAALRQAAAPLNTVDQWLIDGIIAWIDAFLTDHIALRVFPFEELPEFSIFAKLKRDCFTDDGLSSARYAYGSRPNVKLTVLGLVTSLPPVAPMDRDPRSTAPTSDVLTEQQTFGKAFESIFDALDGLEQFSRWSDHYPNAGIYPLAVYRSIRRQ